MKRRSFLASILAAGVAPAAIGSGVLMPIRQPIWMPDLIEKYGYVFIPPDKAGRAVFIRGQWEPLPANSDHPLFRESERWKGIMIQRLV